MKKFRGVFLWGGILVVIYSLFVGWERVHKFQTAISHTATECIFPEYIPAERYFNSENPTFHYFPHVFGKTHETIVSTSETNGIAALNLNSYAEIRDIEKTETRLTLLGIGAEGGWNGLIEKMIDFIRNTTNDFFSFVDRISLGYSLLFYLALFAFFFLLNIALVVTVTLISNWIFNSSESYYKKKRKEIIEIVSPYFYDDLEDDEESAVVEKLSLYKSSKDKQIVIDVLIEGKRNFTGEGSIKIKALYQVLQLHKVSLRKIKYGNWYRRSVGLRELAFLGRRAYKSEVEKYINDKHQYVRTEAILSYMLLDDKNPFGFLMDLKYSFVRWDSLSIYYTMYFNGIEPPPMANMLQHLDLQVRLFLLRMISIYNQLDAVREVAKCLLDENPEIRKEAIVSLRSLEYYRVKVLMKNRYIEECHPVRLEILRSMKHFIEDDDISFVEERVRKGSFDEVFEAVKLLYKFSGYGEQRLWLLNEEMEGKIAVFIKHVAEPRNKHVA